jgi:DNA-binding CsgD family transcriptional regulator
MEALMKQQQQRQHESLHWLRIGCKELSPREVYIIRLISYGYTTKEIGLILHISPLTVQSHLRNAYETLGLHKQTDVARWYFFKMFKPIMNYSA